MSCALVLKSKMVSKFYCEGQIVNSLGLGSQRVFVTTTQKCQKVSIVSMSVNGHSCVQINLFTESTIGHILSAGLSMQTSVLAMCAS